MSVVSFFEHYYYYCSALIDGRWLGRCLVLAMGATLLCALANLPWLVRRAAPKWAVVAILVAAALTLVICVVWVERHWSEVIRIELAGWGEDSWRQMRELLEALSRMFKALVLTSQVLLLAMLVVAGALLRKQSLSPSRWVAISAALLFGLTCFAVSDTFQGWDRGAGGCTNDCLSEELGLSLGVLRRDRFAIAGLGASAWLFSVLRWRRAVLLPAGTRLARAGTALLVLGLVATVATRNRRWDAAHLMPLDAANRAPCFWLREVSALPLAPPDCVAQDSPMLHLLPDQAMVDGTLATDPDEVTKIFEKKADLWRYLYPGQQFPGHFTLHAPAQAKPAELLRWLLAMQRAGYVSFGLFMRAPLLDVPTRTLGTLHKQRCCERPVSFSENGAPLTSFPTWDDLGRATHGTDLSISLR